MTRRLARSAGLIGIATMSSRLLGLVRDMVQAALFGTGWQVDAFVVATRIPTLLRDLFAEGAMSAAFVPTFTRVLSRDGREAAWRLGAQVINALVIVTGVLVVAGIFLAEPLVTAFAGRFAEQYPGKLDLAIELTRINMPFLTMVAMAAAMMGMLNALRRFFIPSTAPALYNVIFIVCAVTLYPVFEAAGIDPVMSLTSGMLLGGLAQIAIQWPALRREGYRHSWSLDIGDSGLREVLMLMGPGTIGIAAAQVNIFVNTTLATGNEGAVSALSYAFRFMYLPVGIIGVSVATAALPDMAKHGAALAFDAMRGTVSWGLRMMLVLSVPATLGLMALARPIVELIFERREFDATSTLMTSQALLFYSVGIVGYSLVKIASPGFYSMRDARTPVIVSLLTIVINLVLNLQLNQVFGFRGLALGTSIAATFNGLVLLTLLSRRIGGIEGRRVLTTFVKILVASVAMAAAAWGTEAALHAYLDAPALVPRLIRVFGGISAGVVVLVAGAWLLRIEEFHQAVGRVLRRVSG